MAVPVAYLTYSRTSAIAIALAVIGVIAVSRDRWQVSRRAPGGGGILVVIFVIRDHPQIANGRGIKGADVVAEVCAVVVGACVLGGARRHHRAREHVPASASGRDRVVATAVAIGLVAAVAVGRLLLTGSGQVSSGGARARPSPTGTAFGGPQRRSPGAVGGGAQRLQGHIRWAEPAPARTSSSRNRDARRDTAVRDAHSLYVETLAERGGPGLLLLLGRPGRPAGRGAASLVPAARRRKRALPADAPSPSWSFASARASTGCGS